VSVELKCGLFRARCCSRYAVDAFTLLGWYETYVGSYLSTFRESPSVSYSRSRQSKKDVSFDVSLKNTGVTLGGGGETKIKEGRRMVGRCGKYEEMERIVGMRNTKIKVQKCRNKKKAQELRKPG
jgi:hypothetical protein